MPESRTPKMDIPSIPQALQGFTPSRLQASRRVRASHAMRCAMLDASRVHAHITNDLSLYSLLWLSGSAAAGLVSRVYPSSPSAHPHPPFRLLLKNIRLASCQLHNNITLHLSSYIFFIGVSTSPSSSSCTVEERSVACPFPPTSQ